jgi:hypothetical protein
MPRHTTGEDVTTVGDRQQVGVVDGAGCCGSLQLQLVGCTWVALATNEGASAVGMGADVAPNVVVFVFGLRYPTVRRFDYVR